MEFFNELLMTHSVIQAVIVLSLISAIGLALGRLKIAGISLGVTFVFFVGIMAGHLGLSIDPMMRKYAESFGLILFVYALGLQVGPGFFGSFRKGGISLNLYAMMVVIIGTAMTLLFHHSFDIPLPDMVGVLCGAVTNTPALGAAQQTLHQLGTNGIDPALSCAVSYPLGVVGVILAMLLVNISIRRRSSVMATDQTFKDKETSVVEFGVTNPGIFDHTIKEVASLSSKRFVISRIWREGTVTIPTFDTMVRKGDHLLVISRKCDQQALTMLFGEQEDIDWNTDTIDWNKIDSQLSSSAIFVTQQKVNGRKLGDLRLRNKFGINITRVMRAGVQLMPTSDLVLQLGDRVIVVGEASAIKNVEEYLGNRVAMLKEPNLVSVFIGMVVGLVLGMIPIHIPGIDLPVRIGLAGGPIVVGLILGAFGPRFHLITYTTRSANLMLRALGLSLYLACLGLDAGVHFFDTVFRAEGLLWVCLGFLITVIPPILVGVGILMLTKLDKGSVYGMMCGSMSNPMALTYANTLVDGDTPAVAYATVYPLTMFARVIIAQLIFMLTI